MRWVKNDPHSYVSDDGRYQVWHLNGDRGHYEARRRRDHRDGPGEVGNYQSLQDAMQACEADARK